MTIKHKPIYYLFIESKLIDRYAKKRNTYSNIFVLCFGQQQITKSPFSIDVQQLSS